MPARKGPQSLYDISIPEKSLYDQKKQEEDLLFLPHPHSFREAPLCTVRKIGRSMKKGAGKNPQRLCCSAFKWFCYSSWRPSMARCNVTSSAYSRSPPTGMP